LDPKLKRFFEPRSVAIVGASSTPHKPGNDVILNILANDFKGDMYLVNPKGGNILGRRVYSSPSELPLGIDLGVIILPASTNPGVIRDCAARGIEALILVAGGFAEAGEEGASLQRETIRAIRETGVRVLGPNTSGLISMPQNFASSFFPLGRIPRGKISYVAQTGNFATHTMRYIMSAENFGVCRVAGLGNKVDVDESEILEYLEEDKETRAVLMYLEGLKSPRRFLEVARRVSRRKPLFVLKGGSTEQGARAATTHTASLASDDRIIEGALKQAGVVRLWKYAQLVLVARGLAAMPLPRGRNVAILAPSGAMLVCLTDLCERRLGLRVPDLDERSRRRLQDMSPSFIRMRNPVDIWPAATLQGVENAYREGMDIVLEDESIHAALCILMLTDETGVPSLGFLVELANRHREKPIYVTCSGERKHMVAAKAFLEPQGVPTFWYAEEALEVLSFLAECREALSSCPAH
jgi:acyl-CoA synthetase (NDP forming)